MTISCHGIRFGLTTGEGMRTLSLCGNLAKLLRHFGIAQWLRVEIHQMEPHAMLDLAFAQITQPRRPLPVLHQIIRHMLREENVPGVAAIHHPLRHVDPGPGDVVAPAHIGHFAHRPAVNAHPHRSSGCFRSASAISSAQRAGSSAL